MSVDDRKLRLVLKANAAFSCLSGVLLLMDYGLADLMNANATSLKWVGAGLLLFATTVVLTAIRKVMNNKQVMSIIVQDMLWVLASLLVIVINAWNLSTLAYWLIGFTAVIVASFGTLQWRLLRRIR